jgi:hypothetical protein
MKDSSPSKEELSKKISIQTDEELFDMLYLHREDWTDLALEIASEDWKKRDLNPTRIEELRITANKRKQEEDEKADEPLSWPLRIFYVILTLGIWSWIVLPVIAEVRYRNRGYSRKYREFWICMGATILVCLIVLGLKSILFISALGMKS